jgi:hypothetical protein
MTSKSGTTGEAKDATPGIVQFKLLEGGVVSHNWEAAISSLRDRIAKDFGAKHVVWLTVSDFNPGLVHPPVTETPEGYGIDQLITNRINALDKKRTSDRDEFLDSWERLGSTVFKYISKTLLTKLRMCGSFYTDAGTLVESFADISMDELNLNPQYLLLHVRRLLYQPNVYKAIFGQVDPFVSTLEMEEAFDAIRIHDNEDIPDFKYRLNKARQTLEQYGCAAYIHSEKRCVHRLHRHLQRNSRFKGLSEHFAAHCPINSPSFPQTLDAYCERLSTIMVPRPPINPPANKVFYGVTSEPGRPAYPRHVPIGTPYNAWESEYYSALAMGRFEDKKKTAAKGGDKQSDSKSKALAEEKPDRSKKGSQASSTNATSNPPEGQSGEGGDSSTKKNEPSKDEKKASGKSAKRTLRRDAGYKAFLAAGGKVEVLDDDTVTITQPGTTSGAPPPPAPMMIGYHPSHYVPSPPPQYQMVPYNAIPAASKQTTFAPTGNPYFANYQRVQMNAMIRISDLDTEKEFSDTLPVSQEGCSQFRGVYL